MNQAAHTLDTNSAPAPHALPSQCSAQGGWRQTAETLLAFLEAVKDVGYVAHYEDGSQTPNKRLMDRLHGELAGLLATDHRLKESVSYIVSVVMIKPIPTGTNTQNKLYGVEATSAAEAHGKALALAQDDFPEHQLHTICHWELSSPAPAPEVAPVRRPFDAVKSFADDVLAMLDERIKEVDRATHPFNDYFGDKPDTIVAAKAQASELREVRTQVRILGDRTLVDLMKFRPAIASLQKTIDAAEAQVAVTPADGAPGERLLPAARVSAPGK